MSDLRALLGGKYDETIEKAAVSVAFCRHPVERTPKRLVALAAALHVTGELARIEREVEATLAAVLPELLAAAWDEGHWIGKADAALNAVRVNAAHVVTPNPYRTEGETHE